VAQWTGRPAYVQVANDLRAAIRNGGYPPGTQLPSYEALMRKYDVSITVIRSAVRELRFEGLVQTHQGKGAFVRDPLPDITDAAAPERSEALDAVMAEIHALHDEFDRFEERLSRLERAVRPDDS
jgi:GntR family transcriptional regulator